MSQSINNIKIGVSGMGEQFWVSVGKTKHFYLSALIQSGATLVNLDQEPVPIDTLDLLLNFSGNRLWQAEFQSGPPRVMALHGGATLDTAFLQTHLPKLRACDGIIVNCQSDIDVIHALCPNIKPQIIFLPLPVSDVFWQAPDKQSAKAQLDIASSTWVLGHVARLLPQKNLHRFLEYVKDLKAAFPEQAIQAIVIGNYWVDYPVLPYMTEQYPDYIQRLITYYDLHDIVTFSAGNLTDDMLATSISAMDVLIHPTNSLDENFGYIAIEAMAAGTPVLGCRYGGLKDTVVDNETGKLMSTWVTHGGIRFNYQSGFDWLTDVFNDHERHSQLIENCKAHAAKHYRYGHFVTRLESGLINCINAYNRADLAQVGQCESITNHVPCLLPPVELGFENYSSVAQFYVSHTLEAQHPLSPKVTAVDYLEQDHWTIVNDPCWPAEKILSVEQKHILNELSSPIELARFDPSTQAHIWQLLADGFVVFA
ncbi:glycosyltransferase family 4 protein [Pseudoalteromonas sp. SMS1]|uniref:glycosyltransferase family 4 protein n=1 Tax=Pseudoalteromonas sp. SMS1 TaxID=2908894 RepID=UPI001F3D500C|nr:glycosyltransferase family 4 protein [Pseudoalteromonas sp. SMS1]MCF2856399.1 glycosyltransferase family 4 protein [Pseudoalteromonas sp. SMS1]